MDLSADSPSASRNALAFYESDEYRPYRHNRTKGSRNEFLFVAGEDMTKTAEIPD